MYSTFQFNCNFYFCNLSQKYYKFEETNHKIRNLCLTILILFYIIFVVLQREERWNDWKNKSCPEVKKPNPVVDFQTCDHPKQKYLGDILKDYHNQKKYFMGK